MARPGVTISLMVGTKVDNELADGTHHYAFFKVP